MFLLDWIHTGELQFINSHNENDFTVIQVTTYDDEYVLQEIYIDLNEYSTDELNGYLDDYFPSLEQLKNKHGEDWRQKVAEIIAIQIEIDNEFDLRFSNEEKLYAHLYDEYKIKLD